MIRPLLGAVLALLLGLPAMAQAQPSFPTRAITMIVAYPAGGGTDVAARVLARFLERDLGQPVVVINRPGASGGIDFTELARARADGYTIGFINTPTIVTIPIERSDARFRLDDFLPIANIVDDPGAIWVLPDNPIRDVAGLVAEARRRPGQVSYGTSGIGSDDHLAVLALERLTGTRFLHIPFAGGAPVRTALLSRQIDLAVANIGEGMNDYGQGLMRPIGQMGALRWAPMAGVATFREQGFDLVEGSMRGVAAPAGLPRDVLDRLALAVRRTVEDAEFRAAAAQQQLPLRFLGPDEYRAELLALKAAAERLWAEHPWKE